jgi:hypothetical protein
MPVEGEETLEDLQPSCKLIYFVLRPDGPMPRELADESMLSQ